MDRTTGNSLVVFVSGAGTTLANLAEACDSGKLNARIKAVISNKLDIKASEVARKYGLIYIKIPRMWGPKDDRRDAYKSDEAYSDKLFDWASFSSPKLVVLAGFTAKLHLKPMWQGRVVNIHPSLLPQYGGKGMYGLNVHKAVLEAGEEYSGCTAHVVDNEYDHGPILAQSRVPVLPDDTPTSLAARVQEAERAMYPAVIDSYLKNLTPFPVKW